MGKTYTLFVNAYNQILLNHSEMMVLGIGLGVILSIFNILQTIRKDANRQLDLAAFVNLIKVSGWIIFTAMFAPILLQLLENMMSLIETSYLKRLGAEPKENENFHNVKNTLINTLKTSILSEKGFIMGLFHSIELVAIMIINPFLKVIDEFCFHFAMFYRFLVYGVVQITSPLAVACLLYEPYKKHFESWLRMLMYCYLLVPGFMFVTFFADKINMASIKSVREGQDIALSLMYILSVFLKIFGYGKISQILSKIL